MRPVLLAPVWTILLLGYYHGLVYQQKKVPFFSFNLKEVLPVFFLWSIIVGGIYIINQIYDKENDKINKKLFLISEGHVSVPAAWCLTLFLYLGGIIGGFLISREIFIIFIISIIFSFIYSAPPLSCKNRPFCGLFSNILGHGIIGFAVGWFIIPANDLTSIIPLLKIVIPYSMAIGITFLCTTLPDMDGDKKTGKITFSVKYGKRKTAHFIAFLFLIMMVSTVIPIKIPLGTDVGFNDIPLLLYAEILALPFFIKMVINPSDQNINWAVKIPVLSISVIIALFFWWYFLLLFIVCLFSRLYYKKRFGLNYPTIQIDALSQNS
ncbi:MAG: UbiA family prenyltransferase [bacterium]